PPLLLRDARARPRLAGLLALAALALGVLQLVVELAHFLAFAAAALAKAVTSTVGLRGAAGLTAAGFAVGFAGVAGAAAAWAGAGTCVLGAKSRLTKSPSASA